MKGREDQGHRLVLCMGKYGVRKFLHLNESLPTRTLRRDHKRRLVERVANRCFVWLKQQGVLLYRWRWAELPKGDCVRVEREDSPNSFDFRLKLL